MGFNEVRSVEKAIGIAISFQETVCLENPKPGGFNLA